MRTALSSGSRWKNYCLKLPRRKCLVQIVCVLIALVLGMALSTIYSANVAVYSAHVHSMVNRGKQLVIMSQSRSMSATIAKSKASPWPPPCPANVSLWILGTASVNTTNVVRNIPVRREQYARAVQSLIAVMSQPALRAAFPDGCRHVVYTENNGGPSYLDELMSQARQNDSGTTWEVLYTRSNELSLEKGLKEMSDEFAFVKFAFARGMRDFDWVLKLTGRYRVTVPSSLIDLVVSDAAVPGRFDAAYRPGAYYHRDWQRVEYYDEMNSISGFFGMRAHAWRSFSEKYSVERLVRDEPKTLIEKLLAWFIQFNIPHHRIKLMAYIGAEIAPGVDQYYTV